MATTLEKKDELLSWGKRLRRIRLMADLTRDALAEKANVGKSSLSYWENTQSTEVNITSTSLKKILTAIREAGVECTEQWLLSGDGTVPRIIEKNQQNNFSEQRITPVSLSSLDNEIKAFTSINNQAVIAKVENACLYPVYEKGDLVGGIWQAAATLAQEKFCIVHINGNIQIRRVRKAYASNLFQLSYLTYDPTRTEPFELKEVALETIAPIIRLWRAD